MYFPIGWPKAINLAMPHETSIINHICCDAVKILVAAIGDDFLGIWYVNPLIPITFHRRTNESLQINGFNEGILWKPDSRKLAVITSIGAVLIYKIDFVSKANGVLTQVDSLQPYLKRDSAELFVKESIPCLNLKKISGMHAMSAVTSVCCVSLTEIVLTTVNCELLKIHWGDFDTSDSHSQINLRNISFYMNSNSNVNSFLSLGTDSCVIEIEYSPFMGGFATIFSDCRAAFIVALHLRFEERKMHGFWIPDLDDAKVCSINHKFRLLAYGRKNSEILVYSIEDATGGIEFSHKLSLSSKVYSQTPGEVNAVKWSPDGYVLIASWENGGFALWSTFGTMLMSSLNWDFGLYTDLPQNNPLVISKIEWSTEGYQMFLILKNLQPNQSNVLQLNFVKSALAMNPCMTTNSHILLQGDDTLYLSQGDSLEKLYFDSKFVFPNIQNEVESQNTAMLEENLEIEKTVDISSILSESKYWNILQIPLTYLSTNWPIRYSAIDVDGLHLAVAGRTGLAHYSTLTKKWKLFGNESQEKDFVVSGGLLWWKKFIVVGCFSLLDRTDEIRCYPEDCKLDNQYGNKIQVRAPIISVNMFKDQLIVLTADGMVTMFILTKINSYNLSVASLYEVDITSICIHPACIVSLTVTNLKNEVATKSNSATAETIIINVCGRILMIQKDSRTDVINSLVTTCLASCVECFWLSNANEKSPMRDSLWLYSGAHGMRVWLPILPPNEEVHDTHRLHTFTSKRIMLSFFLKLYPLVILFDNVIILSVENETTINTNELNSHFSLPFSLLERKSQVFLHKILRLLIKRNLGYSAWEIAKSCRTLPYFPHSLELLLHEVLEEEATSKNPIPDALLPSILDFIREFPVYMKTIVQCARKTEIALWPYLFSVAGKPKDLFQQCLQTDEMETAASYLIILQNLEPSAVSKQYATLLLDIALVNRKWDIAKDLIRFLKAIDPNEIDSPRSSMIVNNKIVPPSHSQTQVNSNPEVFDLILGSIARERSFSSTINTNLHKIALNTVKDKKEKQSNQATLSPTMIAGSLVLNEVNRGKMDRSNPTKANNETFFIETILQRRARKLLQKLKLLDLGYMSAFLDFHLVSWLTQEKEIAAKLDDFVTSLITLHKELKIAPPFKRNNHSGNSVDIAQIHRTLLMQNGCSNAFRSSSHTSESGYFSLTQPEKCNVYSYAANPTPIVTDNIAFYSAPTAKNHEMEPQSSSQQRADNIKFNLVSAMPEPELLLDCQIQLLPEKVSVKMRYLLQLFIEANCIDHALLLSILLLDSASIGRIINVVMRSESIESCIRIELALKHVSQWSFENNCVYRSFMISLQPQIYLLNQYIQSVSSMTLNTPRRSDNNMDNVSTESLSRKIDTSHSNIITNLSNINWPDKKYVESDTRRKNSADFCNNKCDTNYKTEKNLNDSVIKNENGLCVLM